MEKVICNPNTEDMINELTATYLEQVCKLFGHEREIQDVEWQVVYDLKVSVLDKSIPSLGLEVVYEED